MSRTVHPSVMVRARCSNLNNDDSCLGAVIEDDLSIRKCIPLPRCLLLGREIKPCGFFENCVAPIAAMCEDTHDAPIFQAAVKSYYRLTNQKPPVVRLCPCCSVAPLGHKQRLCPACRKKKRLQTYREKRAKMSEPTTSGGEAT